MAKTSCVNIIIIISGNSSSNSGSSSSSSSSSGSGSCSSGSSGSGSGSGSVITSSCGSSGKISPGFMNTNWGPKQGPVMINAV